MHTPSSIVVDLSTLVEIKGKESFKNKGDETFKELKEKTREKYLIKEMLKLTGKSKECVGEKKM